MTSSFKDQYVMDIWTALLHCQAFQPHEPHIVEYFQGLFAIDSSMLPVPIDTIKHWNWFTPVSKTCIGPQESPMKSTSEVMAYLVRLGAFPSGLDVRIQSGDVLREQG